MKLNNTLTDTMTSYCRGTIVESERLRLERGLLEDPELLLEFFEFKREIDSALAVPRVPSDHVWRRLQAEVRTRALARAPAGVSVPLEAPGRVPVSVPVPATVTAVRKPGPDSRRRPSFFLTFGLGLTAACAVLLSILIAKHVAQGPEAVRSRPNSSSVVGEILFDSSAELSPDSGVL